VYRRNEFEERSNRKSALGKATEEQLRRALALKTFRELEQCSAEEIMDELEYRKKVSNG
jgi:hypothetical protein